MAGLRAPHGQKRHNSVEIVPDELSEVEPQLLDTSKPRPKASQRLHAGSVEFPLEHRVKGTIAAREKLQKAKKNKEAVVKGKKAPPGMMGQIFYRHPDADPEYHYFAHLARKYYKHRVIELSHINQGVVSASVCNILQSASWCLLASRWLSYSASKPENVKNMLDMMQRAAVMGEKSRQHELAAWELNAREVKSRPKKINATDYMAGFFETDEGEVKVVRTSYGEGSALTTKPPDVNAFAPNAHELNKAGEAIRRKRGRPPKNPGEQWTFPADAINTGVKPACGQHQRAKDPPSLIDIENMPADPTGVRIDECLTHGYDPVGPGTKDRK